MHLPVICNIITSLLLYLELSEFQMAQIDKGQIGSSG